MTAPNHALTGALIGLTVHEPVLAALLAFLSHFACDAIPHYDPPEKDEVKRLSSRKFIRDFLIIGAAACCALVIVLSVARPRYWLLAAVCAFLATSPDLFWLPKFLRSIRGRVSPPSSNWFLRFHSWVQWRTGPRFWVVEAAWFVAGSLLVAAHI